MKTCSRCGLTKLLTEFSRHKGCQNGIYSHCKACVRLAANAYYHANKEKAQAATRAWKAGNADRDRETRRQWARENQGRRRATEARRKASRRGATPPWVNHAEINAIYVDAAKMGLTVDHIHPLQHPRLCGLHVPWNLQKLSMSENARKGNRTFPMELATNSSVTSS